MSRQPDNLQASTLAALLKDKKPKRGRPSHSISRQNVYVSLSSAQKQQLKLLADSLPDGIARADVPDLAITALTTRFDALQRAISDRNRTIPEGVTDLESLYLLWDLFVPPTNEETHWTSIRVSPQQVLDLGSLHGTLNAAFGATRSDVFVLGLSLLSQCLEDFPLAAATYTLETVRQHIIRNYL